MNNHIQKCIEECTDCAKECLKTITHCLKKGGRHAEERHITMLMNCATLCGTSTKFMISGSEFQEQICGVCSQVCDHCADDCAKFEGDREMQECARVCRSCAAACREMSPASKVG